jgi:3',5'-cyclic-AMP phosphodiesterase
MKRIGWVTDIHLNFLKKPAVDSFCHQILSAQPDVLLVGGDIGEAKDVEDYLCILEDSLQMPIYFVLGNHDFYFGSIAEVRKSVGKLAKYSEWLHWLLTAGIIELTSQTCLIGHDTWADGRFGNYSKSNVILSDYRLIEEFKGLSSYERFLQLNKLGNEAADYFREIVPEALKRYQNIIVLVHVPPFKESCWHEGRISNDNWLPHFSCKAVGEVLFDMMSKHMDKQMTVLCGHTHGAGEAQILPNLFVKTGGATYGCPQMQDIIFIN